MTLRAGSVHLQTMRLNQFIAHNSQFSRREADALIESGRVRIGRTKATLQSKFSESDKIFIDGKLLKSSHKYTAIIYHKPKGEIVSKRDELGRRTIYESLDSKFRGFSYVGRLDFASEGLLILSDNKMLVHTLSNANLERVYNLKLDKPLSQKLLDSLNEMLESSAPITLTNIKGAHPKTTQKEVILRPFTEATILKDSPRFPKLRVSLNEGKNRELRRFFAQFGYEILDLKRVSYGFCKLNALPCGKWRYFNKEEYKKLHLFLQDSPHHNSPRQDFQTRKAKN
ncbi:pseudouridine synthase [Helicobacter himalayensis]|uniref:pseudouridine synthase n=1 Tax=Helicobacter himalayensis TaxID=1591088 RepID=UPI003D6DE88B